MQKKVTALRELRRLLSRSEFPPVEAALKAGAVPILVQCLSFGSPDEQVCLILHIYVLPCILVITSNHFTWSMQKGSRKSKISPYYLVIIREHHFTRSMQKGGRKS